MAFAKSLAERYEGLAVLNMSDLIKQAITRQNEAYTLDKKLLNQTLDSMKRHELISDDLAFDTLYNSVLAHSNSNTNACLVVGYPRTLEQALDWKKLVIEAIET